MQNAKVLYKLIDKEISPVMDALNQDQLEAAVKTICSAKHIFLTGMGRTGYMMRALAMRLMQLGLSAYMIGDTNTPSASAGDLLVIGSGSGETESLKGYTAKAKQRGVPVLVLTGHKTSTLAQLADLLVVIPVNDEVLKDGGGVVRVHDTGNHGDKMLLGSRLELCMLLAGEILTMMIFRHLGVEETDMMRRHAYFD